MSEPRRVNLITVPNNEVQNSTNNSDQVSDHNDNNDIESSSKKKADKVSKVTKRFELALNPVSDNDFHEFSYMELDREKENSKEKDPDDPYNDDDDSKLRRIAMEMEFKYGGSKKKRRYGNCLEDYIDKGMGYDETDPFIDNEEAYDELVPSTLTTQHGGFYINCGALDFRPLSPAPDSEDEIKPVGIKKKREKMQLNSLNKKKTTTKALSVLNKKSRKHNKLFNSAKTVAQMLQNRKTQQKSQDNVIEGNHQIADQLEDDSKSQENPSSVSSSVKDVIESVAKGEQKAAGVERIGSGSSDGEEVKLSSKDDVSAPLVKLPHNLPKELSQTLEMIKKAAKESQEGKRSFFTPEINKILLEIETKSRELPSGRTQIYSHLASHLPCSKQTLLKRANKLRMDFDEQKLQNTIALLRNEVEKMMRSIEPKFEAACQEARHKCELEKKFGKSEAEIELKLPRRSFVWNEKSKSLLNETIKIKLSLFENSTKGQVLSLNDYLMQFIDKELKPLWPAGWMSRKIIVRQAEWLHQTLPNPLLISAMQSQDIIQSQNLEKTTPGIADVEVKQIEIKQPQTKTNNSVHPTNEILPKIPTEGLVSQFLQNMKNGNVQKLNMPIDLKTRPVSKMPSSTVNPLRPTSTFKSSNLKSNSPSPAASPLAVNNLIQQNPKSEKGSANNSVFASQAFHKVIEECLGDYPNSGTQNVSHPVRNSKSGSSLLPQANVPSIESLMMGKNANKKLEDKNEVSIIDITSSPEQSKHSRPSLKRESGNLSSTLGSSVNFNRSTSSDPVKKKPVPNEAQMHYSLNEQHSKVIMDRQLYKHQQMIQNQLKTGAGSSKTIREGGVSITPVVTKVNSEVNKQPAHSRHSSSSVSATSSVPSISSPNTSVSSSLHSTSHYQQLQNLHHYNYPMLYNFNQQQTFPNVANTMQNNELFLAQMHLFGHSERRGRSSN